MILKRVGAILLTAALMVLAIGGRSCTPNPPSPPVPNPAKKERPGRVPTPRVVRPAS